MIEMWIVQVWNGRTWRKVRGYEGGPYLTPSRAGRIADRRANASPRDLSSTEGMPHRVRRVEVAE